MKNKKRLVLLMLLLLTVATSYVVSGTYAKYTTTATGTDTARVAKWAWNINGGDITSTKKDFTMNLFEMSQILDNDCRTSETDIDKTNKLVAPGTCGKVTITIKNNSEVGANYAYQLSEANTGSIPLVYSTDGTTFKPLNQITISGTVDAKGTVAGQDLYWKWAYEDSTEANKATRDSSDTSLGFAGTAQVTLTANVTLTQKD